MPSDFTACSAPSRRSVYRAFLEADAMAKWLPPYGFTCKVHHMDAKVGGTFRMSFTNFYERQRPFLRRRVSGTGARTNSSATRTGSTIRTCPGVLQVAVALKQVLCGTEIEHRAGRGPGSDSARDVLSRLAGIAGHSWPRLVEPEIPA